MPRLKLLIPAAAAALILAAVCVLVARSSPQSEYPDSPFVRWPSNLPGLILTMDIPEKDSPRYKDYEKWLQSFRDYLWNKGMMIRLNPQDREVLAETNEGHYIKARELAEKLLLKDPHNPVANFAMGMAQEYGENNLARALFYFRQARYTLEERGRANPNDLDSCELYLRGLEQEYLILHAMDRYAECLRTVDLIEQTFRPMPWLRIWPLAKSHQIEKARAIIASLQSNPDFPLQSLHDKAAIEYFAFNREGYYNGARAETAAFSKSWAAWGNFGEASKSVFRFDDARRGFQQAIANGSVRQRFSYGDLSLLDTQAGNPEAAWQTLLRAKTARSGAVLLAYNEDLAEQCRDLSLLLLSMGHAPEALDFAHLCVDQPDRTGFTSADKDSELLRNGMVLWSAMQLRIAELKEQESSASTSASISLLAQRKSLEAQAAALRLNITHRLDSSERPLPLRPHPLGDTGCESWLMGGFVHILSGAMAHEGIRQARAQETHAAAEPYFLAMEAELAWAESRYEDCDRLARRSASAFADDERLLRARVIALAADANWKLRRRDQAMAFYTQAMAEFPAVFRLLDLPLPVTISDDGSPAGRAIAMSLARSPRFVVDSGGFALKSSANNFAAQATLLSPSGQVISAVSVDFKGPAGDQTTAPSGSGNAAPPSQPTDPGELAPVLSELHNKLFRGSFDVTPVQIQSMRESSSKAVSRNRVAKLVDHLAPDRP